MDCFDFPNNSFQIPTVMTGICCCFIFNETVSYVSMVISNLVCSIDDFELLILLLYLPSAGITGECHHVLYMWCHRLNLWLHTCSASGLTVEPHPIPLRYLL